LSASLNSENGNGVYRSTVTILRFAHYHFDGRFALGHPLRLVALFDHDSLSKISFNMVGILRCPLRRPKGLPD
jgi:hypothetical protein